MSRPSGPVVVFHAQVWSATVTDEPPGHVCAFAVAGPVPDAASGWHGSVFGLPVPFPPTIVTGPQAFNGLVPGDPMSPAPVADVVVPSPSPTAENFHRPTSFAPSARQLVGMPEMPTVRIVPAMVWSP